MCGIYLITNTITNKVYIGQSVNIYRRWSEHKARAFASNNNCYEKPLYRSMRKYGVEAFVLSILCECSVEELDNKEKEYITKFNSVVPNGYNILDENNIPYNAKPRVCIKCGKEISYGTVNQLCRECYTTSTRLVERPSKEELQQILFDNNGNFTAVSKDFGVSDNAIRKWCKDYNLPFHSKDYKIKTK